MRSIDIHAHVTPGAFVRATESGDSWYGLNADLLGPHRNNPRTTWTPEERLADMDALGVDVQVVSTNAFFYAYERDSETAVRMARECNDHVAQMTMDHPDRFSGLCQLPMQDIAAAVAELERGVTQLGLKGAMIGDHVNGRTFDEPEFLPFWKAAEQMGAVILIHQGGATVVNERTSRYHLPNTIGNLADRAVTFASLVFGGVMDRHPNLKVCLSHAGGYTCFAIGRMDRGAGAFGSANPPPKASKRVPGTLLLRLHHPQRSRPADGDRYRRHRPGGLRHRLALRHGHRLAGYLAIGPRELDPIREGSDSVEELGEASRHLKYCPTVVRAAIFVWPGSTTPVVTSSCKPRKQGGPGARTSNKPRPVLAGFILRL